MKKLSVLFSVMGLSVAMVGCPPTVVPSAAKLAGLWLAQAADGRMLNLQFDEAGILVQITSENDDGEEVIAEITGSTSEVDGSEVTVRVPIGDVTAVLSGTLSEDENTIDGEFSQEIVLGDTVTVTVPAGDVQVTRVDDDDDDDDNDNDNGDDDNDNDDDDNMNDNDDGDDNANDNGDDNANDNGDGGSDSTARGQVLYETNCAVCHGADASGGIGPNIQGATVEQLTEGLMASIHASLPELSEQDVADISAYLGTF